MIKQTNTLIFCDDFSSLIENIQYLNYLDRNNQRLGIVYLEEEKWLVEQFNIFTNFYLVDTINIDSTLPNHKELQDTYVNISKIDWDKTICLSKTKMMISFYSIFCKQNNYQFDGVYLNENDSKTTTNKLLGYTSFGKCENQAIYLSDDYLLSLVYNDNNKVKPGRENNIQLKDNLVHMSALHKNLGTFLNNSIKQDKKIILIHFSDEFCKSSDNCALLFEIFNNILTDNIFSPLIIIDKQSQNFFNFTQRIIKKVSKDFVYCISSPQYFSSFVELVDFVLSDNKILNTIAAKYGNKKSIGIFKETSINDIISLENNQHIYDISKAKDLSSTADDITSIFYTLSGHDYKKQKNNYLKYYTAASKKYGYLYRQSFLQKLFIQQNINGTYALPSKLIDIELRNIKQYLSIILESIRQLTAIKNGTNNNKFLINLKNLLSCQSCATTQLASLQFNNKLFSFGELSVNKSITKVEKELFNLKNLIKIQISNIQTKRDLTHER